MKDFIKNKSNKVPLSRGMPVGQEVLKKREKTDFEKKVYNALMLIPKGKVTTYKLLWNFIRCRSAQAIGQALTRNPHAPEVPCHRVIKTDGTIGGYAYGMQKKEALLKQESIIFVSNGVDFVVDRSQIWDFSECV